MGFLSWFGLVFGLILAVSVPVGMLYFSGVDSETPDLFFLAITIGGSVIGLVIAGLSMSLRTWSRY